MSQNTQAVENIASTTIGIEPVGAIFTPDSDTINTAVREYLATKGIRGGDLVLDIVPNNRTGINEVSAYLFFQKNNADIEQGKSQLPPHMRHKLEGGHYRASQKLSQAVRPIMAQPNNGQNNNHPSVIISGGLAAIQLDIFRVMTMLLDANPQYHEIIITEARVVKNRTILTVFKNKKFIDRVAPTSNAQYEQALRKLRK